MRTRILLIAAISLSIAACTKETQSFSVQEGVFTATLDGHTPEVKTQLGSDLKSVVWRSGNKISVFAGDKHEQYVLTNESSGKAAGTFTGNPVSADTYYALYPYQAQAKVENGNIIATIPSAQTANKNNIGNDMNVAVACSNTSELSFKNVGTLIKFNITTKNVGEVILKGNKNEDLAGKVSIAWNNGDPEWTVVEGVKEISLKPYGNAVFETGTYHFVVLPQTFEEGITMTMKPYAYTTNNVILGTNMPADLVKAGGSELELIRSHIKPVGAVDQGLLKSYSDVKVNCLRGTANDCGIYFDFHTGRSFHGIGAHQYASNIEMLFVMGSQGIGFVAVSGSNASGWVNSINLNKFGTSTDSDLIGNWPTTKGLIEFRWLTKEELSDEGYDALETTIQVSKLCTGTLVKTYMTNKDKLEDYHLTNGRITEGTHEYLVFKATEVNDVYYGVMKFKNADFNGSTSHVLFDYKIGR